ncbi:MAG: hypothetical protein FJ290_05925 [Planctomycetes bacterium]|nr:hypothetical protein [Planctomycetota bacterium]
MADLRRVGVWSFLLCVASLAAGARGEEGNGEVRLARAPMPAGITEEARASRVSRPIEALKSRLPAGVDRSPGQPVEMGGDRVLRYVYRDTFGEAWFAEDAAIEGLSCVRWDGAARALHLEGRGAQPRRVSLTYHFAAPYDAKELVTEVQGVVQGGRADCVEFTMSTDGKEFIHPARAWGRAEGNAFHLMSAASYQFDRPSFWIRIAADLAPGSRVTLNEFVANCRMKPPGRREVTLSADAEGRLAYRDALASSRLLHVAEVQNAEALEWRRGAARLTSQEPVVIRQRFVAPAPLGSLRVRVGHAVGPQAPGGSNTIALSLDGEKPLVLRTASGADAGFNGVTELRLEDAAALANAQQFYLHITLAPGAQGAAPNVLSSIEVEARPAEAAAAATVASTAAPQPRP